MRHPVKTIARIRLVNIPRIDDVQQGGKPIGDVEDVIVDTWGQVGAVDEGFHMHPPFKQGPFGAP